MAGLAVVAALGAFPPGPAAGQQAPTAAEAAAYRGLHAAAATGGLGALNLLLANPGARAGLDRRDRHGRTPLMVAILWRPRARGGGLDKGARGPERARPTTL